MAGAGKSSVRRRAANTNVYLIGSGIGSLAAAVYLIRDAKVPGENIRIFDALDTDGGSLDGAGDARRGFLIRGGRMLNIPTYECFQDIMTAVPSEEFDGISAEQEFLNYNKEDENVKENLINSLVNTLTQLNEVNSIKILINGAENEEFNEIYTLEKSIS